MILGQIRCEEALQVVPACRLCYMKTAPNCHNTRPTCCTPQHKTSIKGPFHFRRNNHVLLLSQNINFSLSGHYNRREMLMLRLNISKEFSADILQWSSLSTMLLASSLPCLVFSCLADHQFQVRECILLGSSPNSNQKKLVNLLSFPTDKCLRELLIKRI